VDLGAARGDELVAQRALEGDVRDPSTVKVAELPATEPELDATEAVLVGTDAGPGRHLVNDVVGSARVHRAEAVRSIPWMKNWVVETTVSSHGFSSLS
jgi:hypothetical protein